MHYIEHRGVVDQVVGNVIKVRINNLQGCPSCQVKSSCPFPGSNDQRVEVFSGGEFKPGDSVILVGKSSLGLKAVFVAYVVPMVLIIVTLAMIHHLTGNQAKAAVMSLLVLVPYYLVLSFAKREVKKTFTFTIKPVIE